MKKFANGFARLVFGLCVVMASPAWAMGDNPLPPSLNPKCMGITLTGEKFLDMFHAIAMHGDLTDVPFIEKTLATKFEVKYSDGVDIHQHHYKRAYYTSNKLLGAPIETSLSFDVEREPQVDFKKSVHLSFDNIVYITHCLAIAQPQISQKFGGDFLEQQGTDSGATTGGSKVLQVVGKDGSKISVVYSRMTNKQIIRDLLIKQNW